ncbi:hypothetical protein QTH87_23930 [Variovorax sp. J22P168]|uniref:hypothetical protein n=1 Tax=Variovorax jilinensis TaxID=3053513 RepID=UPI0025781DC6|nr:hypothetical protein [Variovorax sp. J22P168]MDM0015508.1 hypothetical protein [Variovorax sp. J22P168]
MFGLTSLGLIHTAISLVALVAGVAALVRYQEIPAGKALGQTYIWSTVLTCLTGFGIFQRGGFGAPHVLGILTLSVLAIAAVAGRTLLFGRASRYVETIAYSTTLFFHMIPGLTETFTRIPVGTPWFSSPEDPALQKAVGACFVVLVVGCLLQVRRIRAESRSWSPPGIVSSR